MASWWSWRRGRDGGRKELLKFRAGKQCSHDKQTLKQTLTGRRKLCHSMNSRCSFKWMVGFLSSLYACTLMYMCIYIYLLCIHTYICTYIFVEQLL